MRMLIVLFLLIPTIAFATDITLTWDAPVKTEGGGVLTNLAGYNVYEKGKEIYSKIATVEDPAVTRYTIKNVANGLHTYALTAFNTYGKESKYSDSVSATVSTPMPPVNIKIEIIIEVK